MPFGNLDVMRAAEPWSVQQSPVWKEISTKQLNYGIEENDPATDALGCWGPGTRDRNGSLSMILLSQRRRKLQPWSCYSVMVTILSCSAVEVDSLFFVEIMNALMLSFVPTLRMSP
jgi:hypothetical protein